MVRRVVDIFGVLLICLAWWASPAYAQTQATQPTDPSASTPAGEMYAIPLESARQDAAPHGHIGTGGGVFNGGGGSGSSGANGSTSGVTHASGGATQSAAGASSGAVSSTGRAAGAASRSTTSASKATAKSVSGHGSQALLVPGGQPGSLIQSNNGLGASSVVPAASSGGAPPANDGSAPLLAFVLAAAVLLIGGVAGARVWRAPKSA